MTQPSLSSSSFPRGEGVWGPSPALPGPHPALVPGLGLGFAAAGNVVVLGLDLGNDAVHVQLPAVVHLDDDRGLGDLRLEQADLLGGGKWEWVSVLRIKVEEGRGEAALTFP